MPGYRHALIVDAPATKVFAALDFGSLTAMMKMELVGDAKAVGSARRGPLGGGTVVETQVYREVREDYCAHSYNLEPGNPFDMKGYLATFSVRPLSEDPSKCFAEWKATWESLDATKAPDGGNLGLGIGKIMKYTCDVVSGKRKPRPEHEEHFSKL